jgi:hypothetical protein
MWNCYRVESLQQVKHVNIYKYPRARPIIYHDPTCFERAAQKRALEVEMIRQRFLQGICCDDCNIGANTVTPSKFQYSKPS